MDRTSYLEDKTPNFYMQWKDRGGLIYPSKDLVKVCDISEKKIRETRNNHNIFYNKNILHYLC